MAPNPSSLLLATITATVADDHPVGISKTVDAQVYGIGADYIADGIHTFKCIVEPTDSGTSFYAACSRAQARDLSGDVVTLELGPNPTVDLTPAERRLEIVHPQWQIIRATGRRRRLRARRHVPDGPRSALLIRAKFADMDVTYPTEAEARLLMQNPDGMDIDEFSRVISYGRISFPRPLTTVITVSAPFNVTGRPVWTEPCNLAQMEDDIALLVANQHPDIDPDTFDHKFYFIPRTVTCKWAGTAIIDECHATDSPSRCQAWVRDGSGPILAHELGHTLGVNHAADDLDDDGTQEREYGEEGCVMGYPNGWASMNAPHRQLLGYLGDGNGVETYDPVCAAHPSAQVTMTISRLDLAPGNDNPNPNMVRIARFPSSNYLLSFKATSDWDGSTAPFHYINRLQIHTHNDDETENTKIVQVLGQGEVFVGRANHGGNQAPLNVHVVNVSTNVITVTINTGCWNPQGYIGCGLTVSGTTTEPGIDIVSNALGGKSGFDHFWHFTLDQPTTVTFDGCGSAFDTVISVFDRLETDINGAVVSPVALHAQADEGCPTIGPSRLVASLTAGNYSVVMDGYGRPDRGNYSMTMTCQTSNLANFMGHAGCGLTVSGATTEPGIDVVSIDLRGTLGFDHFWHFELDQPTAVTFDGCGSAFDTVISVFDRLETDINGAVVSPVALHAQADEGCPTIGPSRLVARLIAGNYSVVMDGYGRPDRGDYSMTMSCPFPMPFMGNIGCGLTGGGTTTEPSTDFVDHTIGGRSGFDHVWHFTLDQPTTVTFDGCDSAFDTVISVFDRLDVGYYGEIRRPVTLHTQVDEGCPTSGPSRVVASLIAGNYSVVIEGSGRADHGAYSMTMGCQPVSVMGHMGCGLTVNGSTTEPGVDFVGIAVGGKAAVDHFWHFTLDQPTIVTFDGCASTFDTVISVFDRLETGLNGAILPSAMLYAQEDEGCSSFGASLVVTTLDAGDYSVVMEAYSSSTDQGDYSMTMGCQPVNFMGPVGCGLTVRGTTSEPGMDVVSNALGGKSGVDHIWHFTLDQPTAVTFDGCGSTFDTVISVFDRLETGFNGTILRPVTLHAQAEGGCLSSGPSRVSASLTAGTYSVVIEGSSRADKGDYSMSMECQPVSFKGYMACGLTVNGATTEPGVDFVGNTLGGKSAVDHFWHFTLDQPTIVTFDGCGSAFDTVISVFDRLETGLNGAILPSAMLYAQEDEGCLAIGPSRLVATLDAGEYSVVMEGYGSSDQGNYSMAMGCGYPRSTPSPTSRPSHAPAQSPYCPPGYDDYGTRYNWPLGRITVLTSHGQCAARCNAYSDSQYNGGCKSYLTGMYFGMLFCRSYGGEVRTAPCAPWATPTSPGYFSGALGSTNPRTNMVNIGGNCCSNSTFVAIAA